MFAKPFYDLEYEDIVKFCQRMLPEQQILEYKRELYTEPNLSKLHKSVSALANTQGGYIIIGVEEDRKTGNTTTVFTEQNARGFAVS